MGTTNYNDLNRTPSINLVTSPIRNAEMAMANLTHISSSLEESQNFLSKTGATWALETFLAFPNLTFFLQKLCFVSDFIEIEP